MPNLAYAHLIQLVEKDLDPNIAPQDFTAMMELDIATAQALQNGKNGMRGDIRKVDISDEELSIPEYFNLFDVRKPSK